MTQARLRERLQQIWHAVGGRAADAGGRAGAAGAAEAAAAGRAVAGAGAAGVQTIFKIIREINAQGCTILLVEQNAHMALNVAHFGYVLEVGKVRFHDEASRLAQSDAVRKAYLGVE